MQEDTPFTRGLGMTMMILLSAQPDFSVTVSQDLINAFPFEDYEIRAVSSGDTVTFRLVRIGELAH